jgi:hypothetical protein
VTDTRPEPVPHTCTTSELFELLWSTLSDMIGSTATAALLQRSIKRAAEQHVDLNGLAIVREQFGYRYTLPDTWMAHGDRDRSLHALRQLVRELWPILSDLTGPIIGRRLRQVPLLVRCGLVPEDDAA